MKAVNVILECLCPDDMDPDEFGELMLCRVEAAEGIATHDGKLLLTTFGGEA
jgi:hypothetical protein